MKEKATDRKRYEEMVQVDEDEQIKAAKTI
jgi:hypothetical protein